MNPGIVSPGRAWLCLFLLACLSLGCGRRVEPPAEEGPPTAPVKVVLGQKVSLGEVTELVGTTVPLPSQSARVSAAAEGQVKWVLGDGKGAHLVEGQRVAKGDVIVQLDDRLAQANKNKVQAMLEDMGEQKNQAELAERLTRLDLDRLEKLRPTSTAEDAIPLVSRIEIEKARVAVQDSQSKQKAVDAKLRGLKAELQGLDTLADYLTLRAPIAGWLGPVQVVPGQTLAVGAAVADIINLDEIDVLCVAPPHVAAKLALQQAAWSVTNSSKNGVEGRVAFIAVQAQAETGNFFAKVRFPNKELGLRANTVVRVQVQLQPDKERFLIPEAALQEDQDPPAVFVAHDVATKKKARRLLATLGVRDRDRHLVEIVRLEDPEKKGEVVPAQGLLFIVEGSHGLHNDDLLKLEEEKAEEKKD